MKEQNEQQRLEEINRPMNEELFNNLEKQYQELAKVKSESEQIEEMADILCEAKEHDCKGGNDCLCVKQSEALYNAGYRKQSEGEWIDTFGGDDIQRCSVCNNMFYYPKLYKYHFCPNCGAKMKGGAE